MYTFRSRAIYLLGWLLVGLVVMLALPSGRSVASATFTVNTPADVVDETPGDGKCETHAGNGVCTLRAAIQEANKLAGTDTINLAGSSTRSRFRKAPKTSSRCPKTKRATWTSRKV